MKRRRGRREKSEPIKRLPGAKQNQPSILLRPRAVRARNVSDGSGSRLAAGLGLGGRLAQLGGAAANRGVVEEKTAGAAGTHHAAETVAAGLDHLAAA